MLLVIGSEALSAFFPNFRTPKDIDVVGSYDEVVSYYGKQPIMYPINAGKKFILKNPDTKLIVEAELTWQGSTAEQLYNLAVIDPKSGIDRFNRGTFIYPSLNLLYTLKMSHRYLKNSPHFIKTMRDIQLMRTKGAVIPPEFRDFYKARRDETYWYKHPSLKQNKENFFKDDGIKYVWDHDDIHKAVMFFNKPAYEFYKEDNEEVLCSKEKFFAVYENVRLHGGLEEAYTLALERHQIPNDYKPNPKISFDIALMKVCTSITSGFFRQYCWEHYDKIQELYHLEGINTYVNRFKQAVSEGRVKPFTKRY